MHSKSSLIRIGLTLFVGLSMLSTTARSESAPPFLFAWGTTGSGAGQFNTPLGLAVGPNGRVYVADAGNHRVQVFSPLGQYVGGWGSAGAGPGQLSNAGGIAADTPGNLYVADRDNGRIQVFDPDGNYLHSWGTDPGPGHLSAPTWISLDANGYCYVSGGGIRKFTTEGAWVTTFPIGNEPLNSPCLDGKFYVMLGMAADLSGNVYAGDYNRLSCQRVEKFSTNGAYLSSFLTSGPYCIATDPSGNIYVGQSDPPVQIAKYTPQGTLVWAIPSGLGPQGYFSPSGIALDRFGNLYVSDLSNDRVMMFGNIATKVQTVTWGKLHQTYR